MSENNMNLERLKEQFNRAISSNNEIDLLNAFYGLEEYALSHQDYALLGSVYTMVVNFMYDNAKVDLLIRYSVQYLHFAKSIPEIVEGDDYYAIAALMAFMMEDYDQALSYVYQEIEVHKKLENTHGVAIRMNDIAELQLKSDKAVEALNTALDARIIFQELGLTNSLGSAKNKSIIAKIYIEIGDSIKGKQYLDELLQWPELDEHSNLKKEVYISYARHYMALKDESTAFEYYLEALELADANCLDQEKHLLYYELSEAYKVFDDYKQSHKYLQKYLDHMAGVYKKMQTVFKVNTELEFTLLEKEAEIKAIKTETLRMDSSKYDILTGMYTESYMMGMMGSMLQRNQATGKYFSLMIMTMPAIKKVEKAEGALAKDHLLNEIAERLMSVKRSHHVMGRLANDKIVVCMLDEKVEQGKITAQRYMDVLGKSPDPIVVYGGIVDNQHAEAIEIMSLVRMADLALYQSEKINNRQLTVW